MQGFVAILVTVMLFLAGAAARAQATREDLRVAEEIALQFADGRFQKAEAYLSAPLRERLGPDGLRGMKARIEVSSGALKEVQAAYALPSAGAANQAAIPLDCEKVPVDLVLAWGGPLGEGALVDFSVRPRQPRPTPSAPRNGTPSPFPDASYVDPAAFTETPFPLQAAGGPELAGLLAMPKGASANSPVPAVVLLPDMAMEGADGIIGPNRVLRDVALGLATRGIATLRYAPRPGGSTVQEAVLTDAAVALRKVAAIPGINPLEVHVVAFGSGGSYALALLGARLPLRGLAVVAAPPLYDLPYHAERLCVEGALADRERALLEGDLQLFANDSLSYTQIVAGRPVSFWKSAQNLTPGQANGFRGKILFLHPEFDYSNTKPTHWAQLCQSPLRRFVAAKGVNKWLMEAFEKGDPEEYKMPGHVSAEALGILEEFLRWNPGLNLGGKKIRGATGVR